jgi:hypothetical protein
MKKPPFVVSRGRLPRHLRDESPSRGLSFREAILCFQLILRAALHEQLTKTSFFSSTALQPSPIMGSAEWEQPTLQEGSREMQERIGRLRRH